MAPRASKHTKGKDEHPKFPDARAHSHAPLPMASCSKADAAADYADQVDAPEPGSKAGVGKVAVARCRRTDLRQSRARKGSNRLSAHLPTGTPVCLRRKVDARIHWEGQGECRTPKSCAAARAVHRASQHGETAPARNQLLVCSSPFGQGDRVDSVEKQGVIKT